MIAQRAKPRPLGAYPGKVAIRRAAEAARTIGLDIGSFQVGPDGTIRFFDIRHQLSVPLDEFEQLDQAGHL